ncbi:hypothetical protein [Absidia glauca]|uniref:Uncharacterized protein n=1 Tax=Absidia glauca TaxID=4829 RepID=A0A168RCA6_ABSGL|nr:hypothetical protein [Absidia glauca]
MPFRCQCGRSFEKPDSFSIHTSACAPFQHRRSSDTTQSSSTPSFSSTASSSLPSSTMATPFDMANSPNHDHSASFWMPTGITIQNVFEGARRRSMSNATSTTTTTTTTSFKK